MLAAIGRRRSFALFPNGPTSFSRHPDKIMSSLVWWGAGAVDLMRAYAKELLETAPDVVVAESTPDVFPRPS
jgi:hypothetical protein